MNGKRILIIAIVLLPFLLPGRARARMSIGASQGSRLAIGAAQVSGNSIDQIRRGWWQRRRHGRIVPSTAPPSRPATPTHNNRAPAQVRPFTPSPARRHLRRQA